MNDRFKFRFWNRITNKYEKLGNFTNDVDEFFLYHGEYCTIEQCTGLKDKNGRLIYEGDIVFHRDKNVEIGKVEWDKGGFWVVCNKWVIPWNFFTHSRWEVVGNIHENPELLERAK